MAATGAEALYSDSLSFLDDVDYYVKDTSALVVGRGVWRRPPKSEAGDFLQDLHEEASYFDRSARSLMSSSAVPHLEIPPDTPQEETLIPPPWPKVAEDTKPINVGFLIARHDDDAQKARLQYDLQSRNLLWDLSIPTFPCIATVVDKERNAICKCDAAKEYMMRTVLFS